MSIQIVMLFALVASSILGVIAIGAVLYLYLRNQEIQKGSNLILLVGVILLGLSVWQSFEFKAGQMTLKATSALETIKKVRAINAQTPDRVHSITDTCEKEREELLTALQMEAHKRKQVEELLNNLEKSLHDMAMTPIRNLR